MSLILEKELMDVLQSVKAEDTLNLLPETSTEQKPFHHVEDVLFGGVNLRLTIMDERVLKSGEGWAVMARWIQGFHPYFGLPIEGWSGVETVEIMHIARNMNMPNQRSKYREISGSFISKLLKDYNIPIKSLPADNPERNAFYSSKNTNRPRIYTGGFH